MTEVSKRRIFGWSLGVRGGDVLDFFCVSVNVLVVILLRFGKMWSSGEIYLGIAVFFLLFFIVACDFMGILAFKMLLKINYLKYFGKKIEIILNDSEVGIIGVMRDWFFLILRYWDV